MHKLVRVLKGWLNERLSPAPNLNGSNLFDQATFNAVVKFQQQNGLVADGKVGPTTWGMLGRRIGETCWTLRLVHELPPWLRSLVTQKGEVVGAGAFDPTTFLAMYMQEFSGIGHCQVAGLTSLLGAIERDPDVRDVRWAAYMLATVKHECADTWQPVEEYGKGAGHTYGNAVTVTDKQGKSHSNVYYGRGYVQLTWKANYEKMGKLLATAGVLSAEDELLIHPEKALDPRIAYSIMSVGMRGGHFTGHKLADHINGKTCDYKNARKIINGLDQWQRIKGYAQKLEVILRASLR